jgi:hypothetical protein
MNEFASQILFSFFIAGFWIAGATLLAERLGSKIGGLIANLPSNILVSMLFIAISQGKQFASEAALSVPLGMSIDTIFLFVLIYCLRWGLIISIVSSLFSWFVLVLVAQAIHYDSLSGNIFIYIFITILIFIILEKILKLPSLPKSAKKYKILQLIIRAIFAGSVVGGTVFLSSVLEAFSTGLFATFPAVLLSTMIILVTNQGRKFAQATGKVLVLSSSNIVVYSMMIHITYPSLGILWGTVLSFTTAFIWVWLFQPLLKKML